MTQEEIVMKKETLEEAAIRTFDEFKLKNPIVPESAIYPYKLGFAKGTTWQQERMYSEEDMRKAFKDGSWVTSWSDMGIEMKYDTFEQWFKQFKKK